MAVIQHWTLSEIELNQGDKKMNSENQSGNSSKTDAVSMVDNEQGKNMDMDRVALSL